MHLVIHVVPLVLVAARPRAGTLTILHVILPHPIVPDVGVSGVTTILLDALQDALTMFHTIFEFSTISIMLLSL